ncbi:MAG: tetratricopeptide repeat protein [bacterium]
MLNSRCPYVFIFILFCAYIVHGHQYGMDGKNEVVGLLESGRMHEVEQRIKNEEDINPQNKGYINELKSHLAFYRGAYAESVNYMHQASIASPQDESLAHSLLFYTVIQQNANDFIQQETEHFVLRFKGKDIILESYMAEALELSFSVLTALFKTIPEEKIVVEVYPNKEEFSIASTLTEETLKRSGAIGICKFHRLMILSPRALLMGYRWMDALSHELIHLLINQVSRFNTPLWLHEGIARYYELTWRCDQENPLDYLTSGTRAQLMDAVHNDTLIPFKRMSPSMVYLKNQDEVSLAFSEVSNMIEYISTQYHKDAPIQLLEGLQINEQKNNFKKILGISEKALEKKWKKYLQSLPYEGNKGAIEETYIFEESIDEIQSFVGADVQGKVRLGDKFRKSGRYNVALIQYKEALEKEPENPIILTKYARCLSQLNKGEEENEALEKAIKSNPNYVTSYVLLAGYLYKAGLAEEALKYYREANAINPFNPIIHKNMGKIYLKIKDNKAAQKELSAAGVLLPNDPEIKKLLTEAYP